jgi:hypothetical protein
MKKNELVHMHALLRRVARDFLERGIATREDFDEYEALGISPMALRASRDDHEDAVLTLATTLSTVSQRERPAEESEAARPEDESPTERTVSSR